MSDQQPPAPQDTAAVAGPTEAPGTAQDTQEVNWEKRYQDLQPEYTRTTQQLRELEQQKQWYELALTTDDPDTQRQAFEALGYELPQQEEEFEPVEYDDPIEELRAELGSVRQEVDQRNEAMRLAEEGALIREFTDERLNSLEGLAPEDHDMVLAYAINALPPKRLPGVPVPLPDVEGAFEYFQQREVERQKQWAKTKKAPYVMPGGVTADPVPDPGTGHNARMNRAMRSVYEAQE